MMYLLYSSMSLDSVNYQQMYYQLIKNCYFFSCLFINLFCFDFVKYYFCYYSFVVIFKNYYYFLFYFCYCCFVDFNLLSFIAHLNYYQICLNCLMHLLYYFIFIYFDWYYYSFIEFNYFLVNFFAIMLVVFFIIELFYCIQISNFSKIKLSYTDLIALSD